MKTTCSIRRNHALTLIELLVIIGILVILSSIIGVPTHRDKEKAQLLNCLNNLKQVGMAYKIWATDNGGKFPMELSVTDGGTMELMGAEDAWRTYQVMSNELSTTKILFCPSDEERPVWATNFSADLKGKISYFIGLDAETNLPKTLLSGDDNLSNAMRSVEAGQINLASNAPIAWTDARHHSIGSVVFSDGNVQWLNNSNLVVRFRQTGLTTNRLVIP